MSADRPSPLLRLPNSYRAFYGSFLQLHPIQEAAIDPILEGADLVLQSATGSGKTEAVLAPCMERVLREAGQHAVAYVVPTRALAIDLQRRLEPILERLGLRLAVRTGDLKRHGGLPALLLTTPESLDVTLGSANADLRAFTRRIRTVVIDEVHPLVYSYRGLQLAWLLRRLERRIGRPLQKIAVSATVADVDALVSFFGFRSDTARLIDGGGRGTLQREIVPHLVHLKDERNELPALVDDLHEGYGYRKILLFANSRSRCDQLFARLSHQGRFAGVTELHYSNLKPRERHGVERRFRRRSHALCITTSTLELGIDIGDVDGVLLYEPPDTVAAFLQRIGRANRRSRATHFWGICRGELSGAQLLRFLALLRLARQGALEAPREKELPSVLVQQTLSCLYEKKRISREALEALFPDRQAWLEPLFEALIDRDFLRGERTPGLFRPGRRFWECLLERRIWSNFPEAEDDYALELEGTAIADLPRSVVRQLEAGDRVQLAGRRLQVLSIETGSRKRVLARVAEQLDDKTLFWLGAGFQVPFEVAQAIRDLLRAPGGADEEAAGLFSRTRRLLEGEREQAARTVTLANGIEVGRDPSGLYRYRTWLGSVGNLVLRWCIEQEIGAGVPELQLASDEVGLQSTHWIDFGLLRLPTTVEALRRWVGERLDALLPLFPLNAFSAVLPPDLLARELAGFLFDPRVLAAYERYMRDGTDIVAGDLAALDPGIAGQAAVEAPLELPGAGEPLLAREKQRWRIDEAGSTFVVSPEARHQPRAVTGTLVGDFMRHDQCARFLSHSFLSPEDRPPMRVRVETGLGVQRTEQGRRHEAGVLEALEARAVMVRIAEVDAAGHPRSLERRFRETCQRLEALIADVEANPASARYLAQAVLVLPSVIGSQSVRGAGIPDLIQVSMGPDGPVLEVGDIKDSLEPRMSQNWQVAWYGWMLQTLLEQRVLSVRATVSRRGFLVLRPRPEEGVPTPRAFDLEPFFAAMPALLRNVSRVYLEPPGKATWKLGSHCTSCPWLESCYREALASEEIQLLPGIGPGTLETLRALELRTLDAAGRWLEREANGRHDGGAATDGIAAGTTGDTTLAATDDIPPGTTGDTPLAATDDIPAGTTDERHAGRMDGAQGEESHAARFTPARRERLADQITALRSHRVLLRERVARRFPSNLSRAILLSLRLDPLSGLPQVMGWRVLDDNGALLSGRTLRVPAADSFPQVWNAFTEALLEAWSDGIQGGRGPHVFCFGGATLRGLEAWDTAGTLAFLYDPDRLHVTDLRRLLLEHFYLPVPGTLSLSSLGRVLGIEPVLPEPETLLHDSDGAAAAEPEALLHGSGRSPTQDVAEAPTQEPDAGFDAALEVMSGVWRWARAQLESGWTQTAFDATAGESSPETRYTRFLEEERRLREEDITRLQRRPLAERVELLRAIGPLTPAGTMLDADGSFLYAFQAPAEAGGSKLREGDFLKLAPVGSVDPQRGASVILATFDRASGWLAVRSRRGRLPLAPGMGFSLEEDLTDWNGPKLEHAVRTVFSPERPHRLASLLEGRWLLERDVNEVAQVRRWLEGRGPKVGLNDRQREALELPFRHRLSLIEGPPGTGKTHLLAWTLIALVYRAREAGVPMRIAVSALTHSAIDQVLRAVIAIVRRHPFPDFPARCFKLGRQDAVSEAAGKGAHRDDRPLVSTARMEAAGEDRRGGGRQPVSAAHKAAAEESGHRGDGPDVRADASAVELLLDQDQLAAHRYAIVGATGFGLYQLFEGHRGVFPQVFDRVVFDEASQVLVPQALLTLLYGKGEYLFYGDVKQLPPVVLGRRQEDEGEAPQAQRSVLETLLERYGSAARVRLDLTYRMNAEICAFPSRAWYDGELRPAPANAGARLPSRTTRSGRNNGRTAAELEPGPDLPDDVLDPSVPAALVRSRSRSDEALDEVLDPSRPVAPVRSLSRSDEALDEVLDPSRPVALLLLGDQDRPQEAEVEVVVALAARLMVEHGLGPERLALISPHRAQNSATAELLSQRVGPGPLPLIDTVERVQGAERDVILYALSVFDPDLFESGFVNSPNRFNVALTRARQKLIVIGSEAFFSWVPRQEAALRANACFKDFLEHCRARDSLFRGGIKPIRDGR